MPRRDALQLRQHLLVVSAAVTLLLTGTLIWLSWQLVRQDEARLDPSSRELRPIHETARGDYIPGNNSVAWMPDGKSLLFVTSPGRTKGTPMSLFRILVTGGQPAKVFEADTIFQVRVHPNGTQMAIETRSFRMETRAVAILPALK